MVHAHVPVTVQRLHKLAIQVFDVVLVQKRHRRTHFVFPHQVILKALLQELANDCLGTVSVSVLCPLKRVHNFNRTDFVIIRRSPVMAGQFDQPNGFQAPVRKQETRGV